MWLPDVHPYLTAFMLVPCQEGSECRENAIRSVFLPPLPTSPYTAAAVFPSDSPIPGAAPSPLPLQSSSCGKKTKTTEKWALSLHCSFYETNSERQEVLGPLCLYLCFCRGGEGVLRQWLGQLLLQPPLHAASTFQMLLFSKWSKHPGSSCCSGTEEMLLSFAGSCYPISSLCPATEWCLWVWRCISQLCQGGRWLWAHWSGTAVLRVMLVAGMLVSVLLMERNPLSFYCLHITFLFQALHQNSSLSRDELQNGKPLDFSF